MGWNVPKLNGKEYFQRTTHSLGHDLKVPNDQENPEYFYRMTTSCLGHELKGM